MVAAIAGASVGGYLFNLVAIRWLGAPGYGEVAALTSLTLLVLIPLVSIQNAVGRDVAHLSATSGKPAVTALFRRWLARMLGLGLLLGGAVVLATGPIQDRLGIESAASVWLTAVGDRRVDRASGHPGSASGPAALRLVCGEHPRVRARAAASRSAADPARRRERCDRGHGGRRASYRLRLLAWAFAAR